MADTETAQAPTTIELNDALFCTHFKEVCTECNFDGREENDSFFGFDHHDRDPIEAPPAIVNKDGVYQCKKHASAGEWSASFPLLLPLSPSTPLCYSPSTCPSLYPISPTPLHDYSDAHPC
ncbi:hypothetical protein B0H19DRAFT_1152713 [Mycena capillaripes]|nr:hypothetical protein B0H19DRAFT_1152713 [Mycena capillaripes]